MLRISHQNLILASVIVTARQYMPCPHARVTISELRRGLRLDDTKLSLIIEMARVTGRKLEWTSSMAPSNDPLLHRC